MKQDSLLDESVIEKEAKHYAEGWGENDDKKSFIAGAAYVFVLMQNNLSSHKGSSREQLYFNTLTEGQRIRYFEDVEKLKSKKAAN